MDFLARAAHLWDAEGAFGQLQNQAYGYLWPMGPFFALGDLLDLPGWVVQRLWLALVLCVAFLGTALLARALGVRSDLACIVAGFAFALSPRMLTVLGPISIEVVAERPGALGAAAAGDRRSTAGRRVGRPRCPRWRWRWWAASTRRRRSPSSRSACSGCSPASRARAVAR